MADLLRAEHRVDDWKVTRETIATAVLTDGWSEEAGAFTQAFGSAMIDASALLVPIVGLLPGDDPRVLSTIDAVQRRLRDARGFVHRYDEGTDGFEGTEGAFVMCTFWLAHALALGGKRAKAVAVFRTAASASNDLGLMAEEIDPRTGEMLGNSPQAFSQVGLVTAAYAIAQLTGPEPDSAGDVVDHH